MERPISKPVGTPAEQLDTPALVVDLEVLERNIETLHSFFGRRDAKVRPHVESHRCPAIAHKQLAAGGTVGGISVTTVGQAEVFGQQGFGDIFVASEVVTPQKIARLCALARSSKVTVATDNPKNIRDLSDAAQRAGVTLSVVVDIHTRLERCGVEPGKPAVDLAIAVGGSPGLHFAGLMTYEGAILAEDSEELLAESRRCVQPVLDTREMVEQAGLDVELVSVGGTHNYEIVAELAGVTEVPAGSYALMDHGYERHRPQFAPAAKVLATVISRPEPEIAVLDTGQKSIGIDAGMPVAEDTPGATVSRMDSEHGGLDLEGDARGMLSVGDKVWLTPRDIGNCVNIFDFINGVRDGNLEVVWEVSARGSYR